MPNQNFPELSSLLFGITTLAFATVVLTLSLRFRRLARRSRGLLTPGRFLGLSFLCLGLAGALTVAWGVGRAGFAAFFAVGLVLGLMDPVISVCVLVSATLLRPWELVDAPSMAVIPKLAAAACVASWVIHAVRAGSGDQASRLVWSAPVKLFLGFAAWVLLNAVLTGDPDGGLTLYMNTLLVSGILFLLVVNIVRSDEAMRLLERSIGISVVSVIAVALMATYASPAPAGGSRRLEGFGLLGNANDLAALIVLVFPLLAVPALEKIREKGLRAGSLANLGALAVLLLGLWSSESRGAMIGLFCSGAAFMIARSRRPARGLMYAALLLPLMLGTLAVVKSMRRSSDVAESSESRLNYMLTGLNMAIHHPVMGVGFNNYPSLYEAYAPSIEYEWGNRTAHSTWVLALAETGFPGFLLLAALFWVTLRSAWRQRREHPELLCSMSGYGVAMSFLSHTYTLFPYLIFSLVVAGSRSGTRIDPCAGAGRGPAPPLSQAEAEARAVKAMSRLGFAPRRALRMATVTR